MVSWVRRRDYWDFRKHLEKHMIPVQNVWKNIRSNPTLSNELLLPPYLGRCSVMLRVVTRKSSLTDHCHSYRSVCGNERWTELIGASHLSSEGHCCLLIQCHDKLAQIKPYTQRWMMSLCLCECMWVHVHLDTSFSESASLIFGNQISIRFEWMTKTIQIGQRRGLDWWAVEEKSWEMKGRVQSMVEGERTEAGRGGGGARMLIHYIPQKPRGRLQ